LVNQYILLHLLALWCRDQWSREGRRENHDSRLVVIDQCGQVPPQEKPEEFNRVVLEFLGQ
jgi:pimeloyl-ACP methyl ester carboxylesterase